MSKYTTEVRFICESLSDLEESKGFNNIDTIIANSWDKIFTTTMDFTSNNLYKPFICKKILKHYYTREIGAETVGLWKLWMNERFETILPYYDQMYQSQLIQFDPMKDTNYTRALTRDLDSAGTASGSNSGTNSETSSGTSSNTHRDLYSDTPQGAITGLENENYLTNARKVTDSGSTSGTVSGSNSGQFSNSSTDSTDERVTETINGKRNGSSYSKMLQEFRDTMLNLDMMIIDEFKDLFFDLW